MEAIMDILIKLIGSLAGVAVVYAVRVASVYLNEARKDKQLDYLVSSAVQAAEQLFKAEDEDGQIRLQYVQGLLMDAGYELTEAVMALIESKVYALNIEARK